MASVVIHYRNAPPSVDCVSVFDNRLNVPVVRWMLEFNSSDLKTCKVHIAMIRDMPSR